MAKWTRVVTLAAAFLLVAAPTASADPGLKERPYVGVWSGTSVMFTEGPDWCLEGYAPAHLEGSGIGRHLGVFHVDAWHCSSETGEIVDGYEVITAANGDEMYGTYSGFQQPVTETEWIATIYHAMDGGTGRFENATSDFDPSPVWTVVTGPTTAIHEGVITGTITYDASDRSN